MATQEQRIDRLLQQATKGQDVDLASHVVLRAAMVAAVDVTHGAGTPEATDKAVLATFSEAVRLAVQPQLGAACPEVCGPLCLTCYPEAPAP